MFEARVLSTSVSAAWLHKTHILILTANIFNTFSNYKYIQGII